MDYGLREARERAGISVQQLARKMRIWPRTIRAIEDGANADVEELQRLAVALAARLVVKFEPGEAKP